MVEQEIINIEELIEKSLSQNTDSVSCMVEFHQAYLLSYDDNKVYMNWYRPTDIPFMWERYCQYEVI